MLNIPGYTFVGELRTTGANRLLQAVRDVDGVPVILKCPISSFVSPLERERYRRESGILQRLRSVRGVARLHACEQVQDRPVLILEEVQGSPLSQTRGEPFEIPRFFDVAIALASTLSEIHLHGVIHKDIKPSNIMLTPQGQVRIIDFGTATLQRIEHVDATPTTAIEGTLAYISPEQTGRMNRSVDYRTDLYSLGVTFYELLTGVRPFQGTDALEWFHAHMAQVPRPPHELNPYVPPMLSAIVMKLLAKLAEERYQSATGLKIDLERCREALGQQAAPSFPLGTQDIPIHFQIPQRLYGRASQVATLLQGFERIATSKRPELILVTGYSGIGKSSVVNELHKPVVQRRAFFLSGKFDQFQRDIPYATLAQAIRGLVQHLLAATDAQLARWRERLHEAWADQGKLIVDLVPQLELVVGPQPAVEELSPADAQHRLNRVFLRFLGVFATSEHPLVVFLDDLQWADMASLRLLQFLLTQEGAPPVLWIGAYRDNEVSPSHPLVPTLAEVRKAGTSVTDIHLEPLRPEEIRQLVTDALPSAKEELLLPLAEQLQEKTAGNPFFLIQLLQALNQDGLLTHTPEDGWRWDAEGVEAKGYSDNVVDFLVGGLHQLPVQAQHLLRLAACVGSSFPLSLLAIISGQEASAVEQGLEAALEEGLLARGGAEVYRFLHDRIQQAAHSLIPEGERKAVHLRIGRLLLSSLSPAELREKLFDIVSHLNAGEELISDPAERHRVARLNAEAGWRAQASSAHRSAVAYLTMAFTLIPGDPWETDHELTFKAQLDRASSELMSGNAAEAGRLADELRTHARGRHDSAAAYCLKNDVLMLGGQIEGSVACLLECLELLGMRLSARPTWEEVAAAHDEVWALLGDRPIASLIDLPLMTDPDTRLVMKVLGLLFGPAYFIDNHLLILHLCRMVSLSIRYGNTDASVQGYGWFGMVLGSNFFRKYQEGYAFSLLGRDLAERYNLSAYKAKAALSLELITTWCKPLAQAQEHGLSAFEHGLQNGDLMVSCYASIHIVINSLVMGQNLDDVYRESVTRLDFVRKAGFVGVQDIIHNMQRYVQQLRGRSLSFDTLSGDGFDEKTFEEGLTPLHMSSMVCWYWVIKMQSRFMCGAYAEARHAGDRAISSLWSLIGFIPLFDFHFYRALTLAACHEGSSPMERQQALEDIRRHLRQLHEWAANCPETFRAPERIVSAELARIEGHADEAAHAYEEAIHWAREHRLFHFVGIASELAANFQRHRRLPLIAEAYAGHAQHAYLQWGAQGKVQQLNALWSQLVSSKSPASALTTSTDSSRIDALTVVKAQQAISSEIVLERLVATLMRVAIENAGAQRGALLLPREGQLTVVASLGISPGAPQVSSTPEASPALPWTLIAYARRTHERLLIDDTARPHPFSTDPYLQQSGARSVLCLPLLRQGSFYGLLYLEHGLASGAFTPARLALLEHLASQAAISVENAQLYADVQRAEAALRRANDELEKRVEERTRELKEAQSQLVDTARAVGMAEVASDVLHNVGNVLTSAVVNLEQTREAVETSRVKRMRELSTLLDEHRGDLAEFFGHDPRGRILPDYVSALTEQLLREQSAIRENLDAMGHHIEHIRSVVQVQQTYAKTSLLIEECELSRLFEDALRVQMAALRRHGITLSREYSAKPTARVDKHKVLQILINLISNAKYAMDTMPEGQRHLHVRLTTEGEMARLQVVDSGMGILPEVRSLLFTHGFTTRKEGHGFGLHTSSLAAKLLGGRLLLESAGPGTGATATLELPLTRSGAS